MPPRHRSVPFIKGYVCPSCRNSQHLGLARVRSISQSFLRKKSEAAEQWSSRAEEVRAGKRKSMLSILEERGFVNSITGDRDTLDDLMTNKRIGAYVGIDPTAPSLHVGHLLPFMALFWLYVHGFHTVSLLGGATAKIGDPTGRTESRKLQPSAMRKANIVSMHYQLKKLWQNVEQHAGKYGYIWEKYWHRELVNNNTWLNKLTVMELLSLLGPGLRIGTMLGKDTVQRKMQNGDGMSFAEFTYPILQAWDWWHMYQTKGIQMQIGGSDQFGNIVAGIDAVKYISKNHPDSDIRQSRDDPKTAPCGFTVPLLTTSSGAKFGKSAGNAIWLDNEMTSVFDLYQYFVRSADEDVGRYLKLFTFIPLAEIEDIMVKHMQDPAKRLAQHILAREVVALVHGHEEAQKAVAEHSAIFSKNPTRIITGDTNPSLSFNAPQTNSTNAPKANVILPESLVLNQPIARVLYSAGLVLSRSEGHRLAQQQGAYIGSQSGKVGGMGDELSFTPIKNWTPQETTKFIIDGKLLVLRVGKWKVKVVEIVSDEEFVRRGLDAPGWIRDGENDAISDSKAQTVAT